MRDKVRIMPMLDIQIKIRKQILLKGTIANIKSAMYFKPIVRTPEK